MRLAKYSNLGVIWKYLFLVHTWQLSGSMKQGDKQSLVAILDSKELASFKQ
jgi:hypothetical protein